MSNGTKNASHGNPSEQTPLLKSSRGVEDLRIENAESGGGSSTQHGGEDDDWDSSEQNPRNWKSWIKWGLVILVSYIEFLTTMPNFMYAPNITDAEEDLGTSNSTLSTFSLTIYTLGFALGPLIFAPLSELYGRANVYRLCLTAFLGFTLACGLSTNIEMLVAFRFIAGSFGAAPVAIGGAVVGDLFEVKERGTAMSIYQAGQIISAVVGPPIGGAVGTYLQWRWVFWIVCMLAGLALLSTLILLKETHAGTLKRRIYGAENIKTDGSENQTLAIALGQAFMRPMKLLIYSPVVALGCALIFVVIGLLNVFLTELSRSVQQIYSVTSGQSGYMYLGLALGFLSASALFGFTNDRIMHALARRYGGDIQPEFRLPATMAAMPVIVIGTLWYGWTLQFKEPWIVPIVGSGFAGLGITTVQLSITTYMVDSFDEFSASALAAVTMARSVGGAIVPLIGPLLYESLDQGWGNTVLAVVGAVCGIIPVLMWFYGRRWREMYGSEDLMED